MVSASASATLTSITIAPNNPTVAIGNTQQFTATGTYSDGTIENLTEVVTWASSNTNVATISSVGVATTPALGSSTISATLNSVNSSTTITVVPQPLIITTSALADPIENQPYSTTLAAMGGIPPYTWSLTQGPCRLA